MSFKKNFNDKSPFKILDGFGIKAITSQHKRFFERYKQKQMLKQRLRAERKAKEKQEQRLAMQQQRSEMEGATDIVEGDINRPSSSLASMGETNTNLPETG